MAKDLGTPHASPGTDVSALVAGFPGGALLIGGNGSIVAMNDRSAAIAGAVEASVPALEDLIARARVSGAIASTAVAVPGSSGESVHDVTAVPGYDDGAVLLLVRDQTAERNLRAALIESRQRYKDLVESSSDFAWEVGADGRFAFVSPRGALGYRAEDLVGQPPELFVEGTEDYAPLPFLADHPMESVEMWMRRADGRGACVVANCLPLVAADGSWRGARGVCRDITGERDREALLARARHREQLLARARHREQLLNYIVGTIRDEVEPADMLTAAAEATSRSLGARGSGVFRRVGESAYTVAATYGVALDDEALEDQIGRLDGDAGAVQIDVGGRPVLATATHYRQQVNGAVFLWRDAGGPAWGEDDSALLADVAGQLGIANEQINNHERILKLSRTDGLTGLLNRRAFFEEEVPRRITRLNHDGGHAALLYLDLDNLKRVNDVHGHQRGDEAIVFFRDMLLEHTRPRDAAARLGGDEFAVWLDRIPAAVAEERVRDLMEHSAELRQFSGGDDRPMGLSVGVALYDPATGESIDELVARADAAMYAVKHAGKGGYRIAEPASENAGGDQA